jgi:UDP-galactopyranose mutase
MDIELVRSIAETRTDWQIIMIGPTAKIAPDLLPRNSNIHYLGQKKYDELPAYLSGWQVAILPFARNDATRYISPTKTPEYLAAGRPVVSTPIRDVVRPYGDMKLVHIADTSEQFVRSIAKAMEQRDDQRWLMRVDAFLEGTSWDRTWSRMNHLISVTLKSRWLKDDYRRTAYVHPALIDVLAKQEVSEDV